jgi:hypothetical protein
MHHALANAILDTVLLGCLTFCDSGCQAKRVVCNALIAWKTSWLWEVQVKAWTEAYLPTGEAVVPGGGDGWELCHRFHCQKEQW